MTANGSPRRRTPARRMLVGAVRIAALLAIIVGVGGILAPALTRRPEFYAVALLFAVSSFVLLRGRSAPVPAAAVGPDPVVVIDESKIAAAREEERDRWSGEVANALEAVRRTKQDLKSSESARAALDQNVGELTESIRALREEMGTQSAGAAARAAELNSELTAAREASEQLRETAAQREAEWTDKLRKALEGLKGDHQRDIAQRDARLHELQRALDSERGVREQVAALARELQHQLTNEAAAQGELQRAMDSERSGRDAAEKQAAELQQAINTERDAHERVDAYARDLAARIGDLENQIASLTRDRDDLLASREAEWNDSLGKTEAQREEARSQAQSLTSRVSEMEQQLAARENDIARATEESERLRTTSSELQQTLEAQRSEAGRRIEELEQQLASRESEWNAKLQSIVAGMASDHENDLGQATVDREAARAEVRHLTGRLQELQRALDALRASAVDEAALRASADTEWSEKLQTIVTHLASDHEADIGKAFEEKEAAKAEARNLNLKLSALQQQIERDRQMFLTAEEKWNSVRDTLKKEIEELRSHPAAPPALVVEPEPFQTARLPTPEPFPSLFSSTAVADAQRARADVLEIAEQAHAVLKRTAPGTIPVPHVGPRPLILFVHHDPTMRTMWRDQLHKSGYDVITAADGLEGLRLASVQKPQIVIADAQMPKMDGRELCQLLKSNEQTSSAKVILMSGLPTLETPKDGFQPDELLRKPVKLEALQRALTNLLGVHR